MKNTSQQFKIMDTKLAKQKDSTNQVVLGAFLAVAIACLFIIPVTSFLLMNNYKSTLNKASQIMKARSEAKLNILDSQINSLFDYSNSIVESEAIRLVLADYKSGKGSEFFQAQRPYIKRVLEEFVSFNEEINDVSLYVDSELVESFANGHAHIEDQDEIFVEHDGKSISSPITYENRVYIDVAVNILDLNTESQTQAIGKLKYRLDITARVAKLLKTNSSYFNSELLSLLIGNKELMLKNGVFSVKAGEIFTQDDNYLSYNLAITNNKKSFIYITKPNTFDYQVKYNYPTKKALSDYKIFKINAFTYGILLTIVMTLFMLAIFWRNKNHETRLLAKQYSKFAKEINKKQTMLESINKTVDAQLTLKDLTGKYIYANKAFTDFFSLKSFSSKDALKDRAIVESPTLVQLFNDADKQVIEHVSPWKKDQVKVPSADGTRYFDITKWPQKDGENVTGIITIASDRTEPILHQKEMDGLRNQAIEALVKTVEIKDPHLSGHHSRMAFVAMQMALKLKLNDSEKLTLEYAARLAGIGKVFVPQALLTKPGILTPEELAIVQTHVDSALKVLNNIDFSLPIVDTIANMYERLDGSGYPNQKTADQIAQLPRVLAISDAFCALIVPRSYRDAIDFKEAVTLLTEQTGKYDESLLKILKEIVDGMPKLRKEFLINLK